MYIRVEKNVTFPILQCWSSFCGLTQNSLLSLHGVWQLTIMATQHKFSGGKKHGKSFIQPML